MRTSITPVALNDRRHVEVGQHVSDGASVAHWLRCKGHPCRICRLMRNVARECGQPSICARGRGVMHLRGVCGRAASPWPRSTKSRGYLVRGTEKLRCAGTGRSACANERRQRVDRRPASPTRGPGSTPPSSSAASSATPCRRPPRAGGLLTRDGLTRDGGRVHDGLGTNAQASTRDQIVTLGSGAAALPARVTSSAAAPPASTLVSAMSPFR